MDAPNIGRAHRVVAWWEECISVGNLNGLHVIESVYLTEAGEPYQVRRSWKERLFSRPWRPLRRKRTIVPQVPMKGGYQLGDGTIVMHPETLRQLINRR